MAAASTARRAPARSASGGIRWDRISRYGLLLVFVLLLFLYVNPLRSYIHTLQESKERGAQVSTLEDEHKRLEARKRALGDPSVVEFEARRLGMVRPGERPFVVRGLPERPVNYAIAIQQWREGERRLEDTAERAPDQQRVLLRVSEQIYLELRRRLGGAFTVDELVTLYDSGTDWAQSIAMGVAPEHPSAWDPRTVVDAAFARYVREAGDYAGGRRLTPDG